MTGTLRPSRSKTVSLRLTPEQHAALASAAAQNNLPVAALTRLFVDFALARLHQGDPELHRVIRISRGG
jgi:uncharacterized protein (DUF1778 family)